jgi:hypothetical protein
MAIFKPVTYCALRHSERKVYALKVDNSPLCHSGKESARSSGTRWNNRLVTMALYSESDSSCAEAIPRSDVFGVMFGSAKLTSTLYPRRPNFLVSRRDNSFGSISRLGMTWHWSIMGEFNVQLAPSDIIGVGPDLVVDVVDGVDMLARRLVIKSTISTD